MMTRADAQACLDELAEAIREQFPASQRRDQFDHHLATVAMVVGHLFEEADRITNQ